MLPTSQSDSQYITITKCVSAGSSLSSVLEGLEESMTSVLSTIGKAMVAVSEGLAADEMEANFSKTRKRGGL